MTNASRIANLIVREVCELPDRTSPAEAPELLRVTVEELRTIIVDQLEAEREATKAWIQSIREPDAPPLYLVDRLGNAWIIAKQPELQS